MGAWKSNTAFLDRLSTTSTPGSEARSNLASAGGTNSVTCAPRATAIGT